MRAPEPVLVFRGLALVNSYANTRAESGDLALVSYLTLAAFVKAEFDVSGFSRDYQCLEVRQKRTRVLLISHQRLDAVLAVITSRQRPQTPPQLGIAGRTRAKEHRRRTPAQPQQNVLHQVLPLVR